MVSSFGGDTHLVDLTLARKLALVEQCPYMSKASKCWLFRAKTYTLAWVTNMELRGPHTEKC